MNARLCFKYFAFFIFLQTAISHAQTTFSNEDAIEVIKDYYSEFNTGYDFDGNYKILTNNYKATFSGSIFTLTFDTFDENENPQNQTKTINLKEVVSIEPYGTDVVEIKDNDPFIIPINGKLAFFTEKEIIEIPIYYEVDDDVTTSQIYKAFETILKYHHKE